MVRYFLTDLRGNPIYSFAQRRLRRNNMRLNHHQTRLSQQLSQIEERQQQYHQQQQDQLASFATTTLVCMVRNQAWVDVLKRCETHPQEIHVIDHGTGNTVLHIACRLTPPSTVIQALAVTPTLARTPNCEGATPLHIAASHKCSAEALRALLDACRRCGDTNNSTNDQQDDDSDILETDDKHTSPTADLSRMGRAPIHYACMSYRGLEVDAFCLLLDTTLKEGNVWVYQNPPRDDIGEEDYDDFFSHQSLCGLVNEESMEDVEDESSYSNDNKFRCEFDKETDRALYQQFTNDLNIYDSKQHYRKQRQARIKVLVNVMGIKDLTGQTPLGLLFRRYRERVRCVINTVDRLRSEQDNPDRAALVAAVRVHADLGELWEKARWIVARLTEERLQRERDQDVTQPEKSVPFRLDATSRRATYYGATVSSMYPYDATHLVEPPSPAEVAVEHEAATFALEQHHGSIPTDDDILPTAPRGSVNPRTVTSSRPRSPNNIGGHPFRIVHASVGLTGYGCPPELIRLAISIHPHQVTEMDEDGNLPLHIAATAASYLATAHHASGQDYYAAAAALASVATDNTDDHSVLSDAAMSFFSSATVSQTTNPFDKVIKILLQQYPEAARIPQGKTGRLPLVLAVESRRRTLADGILTLLHAYPPALHNKKIVPSKLYPNVLSLIANHGSTLIADSDKVSTNQNIIRSSIVDLLPVMENTQSMSSPIISNHKNKNKSTIRHEACSRTTLFQLLRTKPEYLTKYFDYEPHRKKMFHIQHTPTLKSTKEKLGIVAERQQFFGTITR